MLKDASVSGEPSSFVVGAIQERSAAPIPCGATDTVTERLALPPAPVQVRMNVLVVVSELRVWLPDVALLPDQAPDAVHEVASVEDQLRVEEPL